MKQFKILILILLLTGCSLVNNKEKEVLDIPKSDEEEKPKEEYIDNNPIKLGLFPASNNYHNKEVIEDTYYANFNSMEDIGSFEVFLTDDKTIDGTNFKNTWKKYYDNYENSGLFKAYGFVPINKRNIMFDLPAKDREQCLSLCIETPRCVGVNYNQNTCTLYKGKYDDFKIYDAYRKYW